MSIKLFPGPPEYASVKKGDRADYCWILELDEDSYLFAAQASVNKDFALDVDTILKRANAKEVMLSLEEEMKQLYQGYLGKSVSVEGYLFHAHTAHHYTLMLLDVKQITVTST
jgi:hypothetical protein